MPKPELNISFLFKRDLSQSQVTTLCTGDIDGDGNQELIYGGGISEYGTCHILAVQDTNQERLPKYQIDIENGYIKRTICFDINNDGKDEIICGNNRNEIFVLQISNGILIQSNRVALDRVKDDPKTQIKDIKVFNIENNPLIFACSSSGHLAIIADRDGTLELIQHKKIPFECFSILPVFWKGRFILVIGGKSNLRVYEISKDLQRLIQLDGFVLKDLEKMESNDKKDRVDSLHLFEEENNGFTFFCGCRSGELLFFKFAGELEYSGNFPCEGSIYNISLGDVDRDGKNEAIISGRIREQTDIKGYIQIFKIENDRLTLVCKYEYGERIFSALVFPNDKEETDNIIISAETEELVCLKVIFLHEIREISSKLGEILNNSPGKYCFFIGAGISAPILPLADDLSRKLLKELNIPRENISKYLLANEETRAFLQEGSGFPERIPLEAILYWYKRQFSKDEVIQFLSENLQFEPEKIPRHISILAKLIDKSIINYIITVNYDTLIENSTKNVKSLISNEIISTNISQQNVIIKMHGSLEKPHSIEASLDEVGILKDNKKAILDFLFTGHTIFFVGYSCRDPDIYPILKDIVQRHETSCYFIDPNELSDEAKDILTVSKKGDKILRHLQVDAECFFEYFISKMNIVLDDVVTHNDNEVN